MNRLVTRKNYFELLCGHFSVVKDRTILEIRPFFGGLSPGGVKMGTHHYNLKTNRKPIRHNQVMVGALP